MRAKFIIMAFILVLAASLSGCQAKSDSAEKKSKVTLKIATVNNPDMKIMEQLSGQFEKDTGIHLDFVTLPENDLRRKITEDVTIGTGKFDIVTLSNYDTPIWAKNGWLASLDPFFNNLSKKERRAYDVDDIFTPIRVGLSYDNQLYALPFYGESSMLYYNKEMLKEAGVKMPLHPTWQQVEKIAEKAKNANHVPGIVLRGLPGWGQMLYPLDTVINAFGGRWYDMNWNAKLDSPATKRAVKFYVDLIQKAGQPAATNTGFTEGLNLMAQGKAAMWYDATVAASTLNDPNSSQVAGKIGYAYAPTAKKKHTNTLYAWSLAVEKKSKHQKAAFQFIKWATSKGYIQTVARKKGWGLVPSGTRKSTYDNPHYKKEAPFAHIVKDSIKNVDYKNPTVKPVPYQGVQFVAIPEFQELGNETSQKIASAISGDKSVDEVMQSAQQLAESIAEEGGYQEKSSKDEEESK